jgi:hypothetical protein
VEVDGNEVAGETPLGSVEVTPGVEHTVAVLCPNHAVDRKQFVPRPAEKILLDFSPAPLQEAATPVLGTLRLDTEPWSEVYLGKRKLGITPLLGMKLRPGRYKLTLVNETRGIRKTIQATIRAGKVTTLFRKID